MDSSVYRILFSASRHLPLLADIERKAAQAFPDALLPPNVKNGTIDLERLAAAQQNGSLLVALDAGGEPVGFLLAEEKGGTAYIAEVDVHPDYQGRGIGRRLIAAAVNWARERGYPSLTLTTFATLPWNAPFYRRLGFRILTRSELNEALAHQLSEEAKLGLKERVAMEYPLRGKAVAYSSSGIV